MIEKHTKEQLLGMLKMLDAYLDRPLKLLVAGGGALILAHRLSLTTSDIDAIPFQSDWNLGELDKIIKKMAKENQLDPQWLNPYFVTFSYVLPSDYQERLILIHQGKYLSVFALGVEDLLILKCFAGREKDVGHSRYLMSHCKNLSIVEKHLENLLEKKVPKAQDALDFFDDIKNLIGK